MENNIEETVAPMDENGKCSVCKDWARDCNCWICPESEEELRGDENECACGYELWD
jgi:hypothetical protein